MPTVCALSEPSLAAPSLKVHISLSQTPEKANGKKSKTVFPFCVNSESFLSCLSVSGGEKSGTLWPILRTIQPGAGICRFKLNPVADGTRLLDHHGPFSHQLDCGLRLRRGRAQLDLTRSPPEL